MEGEKIIFLHFLFFIFIILFWGVKCKSKFIFFLHLIATTYTALITVNSY